MIETIKDIDEMIAFFHKYRTFVEEHAADVDRVTNVLSTKELEHIKDGFKDAEWYLNRLRNWHHHCDKCGRTFRILYPKTHIRCFCGGVLVMCTEIPPTDRCLQCIERFRCLTSNRLDKYPVNLKQLDNISEFTILEEVNAPVLALVSTQ